MTDFIVEVLSITPAVTVEVFSPVIDSDQTINLKVGAIAPSIGVSPVKRPVNAVVVPGQPGVSFNLMPPVDTYADLPTNAVNGQAYETTDTGWLYYYMNGFPAESDGSPFRGPAGVNGDNAFIVGELPSGATDGTNKTYSTVHSFVTNTTAVYLNGLRLLRGTDYTETPPDTLTLSSAPSTTDTLQVDYQT